MNGTEAYSRLHPNTDRDSCRTNAARTLANANIQALISKRLDEMAMTKNEVLARLSGMARASTLPFIRVTDEGFVYFDFSNPDAMEYLYLIKKIKTKRTRRLEGKGDAAEPWEDEWVEVELHDSQAALEKLGRYHRLEKQDPDLSGAMNSLTSLPADLLAPSFFSVFRDVRDRNHFEYLLKGGRGSTKSSFTSLAFIFLLENNPGIHGIALRQVANTLRDSVYSQLVWAINVLGRGEFYKCTTSPLEIEYLPTGQKIYFRGADKPEMIKSIKPAFGYIGIGWFEELDQFHGQEAVRKLEQSIFRGGELAWCFKTYNPPPTALNWVNKYALIPKENQFQHHSTYLDVPVDWLGKTFIEEAEHLKEVNPLAYEHEYLGKVTGTGGAVFENLEIRAITDEEIMGKKMPNGRIEGGFDRIHEGLDWGYFPHPFSYGKMHYDSTRRILYIFAEYNCTKKGNRKVYDDLIKLGLIDRKRLIIADSAEPKSIGDFREYGANIIGAEKGPDSIDYSIKWLQSLTKIVIDPVRAPLHAQQFQQYEYLKNKDGEYISEYPDVFDDAIDDTRYAMNNEWRQRGK